MVLFGFKIRGILPALLLQCSVALGEPVKAPDHLSRLQGQFQPIVETISKTLMADFERYAAEPGSFQGFLDQNVRPYWDPSSTAKALVGSANFSNAVKSYRGSVYVIAALRNKLFQPNIKFSIAFPQGNPISSDNEFSQFITRLERDENEILKQVSFLIVFNSFAPVGFSTGNSNNAYSMTSIGINTISQLLTKEVNKSVTHLLNKVTGDNSLRFDIGSSVYNSGNLLDPTGSGIAINANKIDRQRVNLKLGRSFLNDKVIVNVGGDLDFNVRSSTNIQNDNLQWLPDLNIEFILTRDRKLRAIVFNRNSLDINGSSLGRRNRQGVSISYRKDFEKFLF
mgnify:CR=1 FL=1